MIKMILVAIPFLLLIPLNAYAIGVISPDSQLNSSNPIHGQTNQLYHLDQFVKMRGVVFPPMLPVDIHSYKLFLAAQVEMDEQGSDPLHPVNSTLNNPDIANIDTQILSYLCEIDTTYCASGDNYPLR